MTILNTFLESGQMLAKVLAKKVGMSESYLCQIRRGNRPIPLNRMAMLEKHSGGALTMEDMVTETMAASVKLHKARVKAAKALKKAVA
jgi:DNA-binding transcriptional regulator YdaS (Cro superfamily)